MARFHRPASRGIDVEITPMIDVVFLLIIFFMTTAQFVRVTREPLELPRERGEQEQAAEEAGLVINITAEGSLVVASETLSLGELEGLVLEQLADDRTDPTRFKLLIRADRNANSQALNGLIERLEQLGVGAARLATEVPR
jgi:biopolymer transport protein ExbD